MFTIYILYSRKPDRFYIGFTGNDIQSRVAKHLTDHKSYTSKAKDWQLVYKEIFVGKYKAMAAEKQIKGWKSKMRILNLISGGSPVE